MLNWVRNTFKSIFMKSNTIYSMEVGVKKVKLAAGRLVGCETDVTIS